MYWCTCMCKITVCEIDDVGESYNVIAINNTSIQLLCAYHSATPLTVTCIRSVNALSLLRSSTTWSRPGKSMSHSSRRCKTTTNQRWDQREKIDCCTLCQMVSTKKNFFLLHTYTCRSLLCSNPDTAGDTWESQDTFLQQSWGYIVGQLNPVLRATRVCVCVCGCVGVWV